MNRLSRLVRHVGRNVYVVPLALGLLFFAASLTPSLIPRDAALQGLLGGILIGAGYLIGRFAISIWRYMGLPAPVGRGAFIVRLAAMALALAVLGWCLGRVVVWQNSVRRAVGMEPVDAAAGLYIILIATAVFAVLLAFGWAIQWLADLLRRRLASHMPPRVANVAGVSLAIFLLLVVTRDGIVDRVLAAADTGYAAAAAFFQPDRPPPEDPLASGGPGSLIGWGAMGEQGRHFVASGPTAEAISAFTGREAKTPLRVYVGREQAATPEGRAAVAVAELARVGGFDRGALIVTMPTGTGWLDSGSHDPVEYLLDGDVATVAVQYSYLSSPLALIFETGSGLDQSVALMQMIYDIWSAMPSDARPRLYLHGISLGAWSSMYGLDLFQMVSEPVAGALWTGPPFSSDLWRRLVARRDPGSPYILPVVNAGRLVRFTDQRNRMAGHDAGWGPMRVVFLQYASDPIVFYEPSAIWREPVWMREPPGHDVSPYLRWIPVVTMLQLALDMAIATSVPQGYGHNYVARDYIPAWVAILDPEGWTDEDIRQLQAHCDTRWGPGCRQ